MSYHTGESLIKLGQRASYEFFSEGTPLGSTIEKLAAENDLNPEQIKRVCEAANKETQIQIYKSASCQTEEFDLANAEEITKKLGSYDLPDAPISSDYLTPPPACISSTVKVANDFFAGKTDYQIRAERIELAKEASRLDIEIRNSNHQKFMDIMKLAGLKEELVDAVKAALEAGHDAKDILSAAVAAVPEDISAVKELLSEAFNKIPSASGFLGNVWEGIKGLFKGGEAVDDALISKALQSLNGSVPLRVINGENKFFGTLRCVYDHMKSMRDHDRMASGIRRKLSVIRQELNAPKPIEGTWY